jgi:hypothetical protein
MEAMLLSGENPLHFRYVSGPFIFVLKVFSSASGHEELNNTSGVQCVTNSYIYFDELPFVIKRL